MRLSLVPTLQAPADARRRVAIFGDWLDEASLSDLKTVVSELVGISVVHGARGLIGIRLELIDGEVEGEVDDHGPGARAIIRAREHRDDSLLLRIVDSLVDDWGTDRRKTRVWFRMAVGRQG